MQLIPFRRSLENLFTSVGDLNPQVGPQTHQDQLRPLNFHGYSSLAFSSQVAVRPDPAAARLDIVCCSTQHCSPLDPDTAHRLTRHCPCSISTLLATRLRLCSLIGNRRSTVLSRSNQSLDHECTS
uniref:Uncharacterized protein n=1 Tax=Plectus sambesii TaxID=2011161 RepID=A0A914V891_9BILA